MKLINLNKKKGKLTGKRMNDVIRMTSNYMDEVPLWSKMDLVDPGHVSLLSIDAKGPVWGIEAPYTVDLDHLKGVFKDGEEFEAEIDNDRLILTAGKNSYWFALNGDEGYIRPKVPNLEDLDVTFTVDTAKISDSCKRIYYGGYASIRPAYDKNGNKTVWLFLYNEKGEFGEGVNLGVSWDSAMGDDSGREAYAAFPAEYLAQIKDVSDRMKIEMRSDYPLRGTAKQNGINVSYLLAPRISNEQWDLKEEDRWIASHNMKKEKKRWKFF